MMANTDDAFTRYNGNVIINLTINESISVLTGSYESGTEINSELVATPLILP